MKRCLSGTAHLKQSGSRDAATGHQFAVLTGHTSMQSTKTRIITAPRASSKHKRHGMNLQVIASPDGDILWVSGALPGSVHDKKAGWIRGVLAELEAACLVTLADKGCQGSTYAKLPYRGKIKPQSQKQASKAHAQLRSPGERALRNRSASNDRPSHPVHNGIRGGRSCQRGGIISYQHGYELVWTHGAARR